MTTGQLVGIVLVFTGLLDLLMAFVIVGPRLPAERRRIVQLSLVVGSVALLALGVVFLTGGLAGASRG